MNKNLTFKEHSFIGSLLFGLFFGAGNLIFPVHMGQLAGSNIIWAILGFIITGVGLPFLGVMAMAVSESTGVYHLASRVSHRFAVFYTMALYSLIGPLYILPRLATTSFEIGIKPFIHSNHQALLLFIYSMIFFGLVYWLSRKPSKLLEYIGKYLNPIFLLLLGSLLLLAFIHPMGAISTQAVQSDYQTSALIPGILNGYNTLDALGSIAMGIIIIQAIKTLGVTQPQQIAKDMIKGGFICMFLMGSIYALLSLVGTMSLGQFAISENGGIALAQIAHYYLGNFGALLLSAIVITACFKTSIGLITACSESFHQLFPKNSYAFYQKVSILISLALSTLGLTQLIDLSIPVLLFIYPLAIILIVFALVDPKHRLHQNVYQVTMAFTALASFFDGLNVLPTVFQLPWDLSPLLKTIGHILPFFHFGFGWVVPSLIGFVISYIIYQNKN